MARITPWLMTSIIETPLVFADLSDAHVALLNARHSPKEVRRAFVRFIDLSQKLTSAMRKDCSALGQGAWAASNFPGWTKVTALLKHLRNEDQHGQQIYISVTDRRYYPSPWHRELGTGAPPDLLVCEGTWQLPDQLLENPPEGMELVLADPRSAAPSQVRLPMVKIERFYIVQARNDETTKFLAAAGVSDVHEIVASGFSTLTAYYAFFVGATTGQT